MKKKDFVTLMMSTVGGILFALGICMALLPEWGCDDRRDCLRLRRRRDFTGNGSGTPQNGR